MGTISPAIPTLGDPNTTEDVDIRNALITLRDEINGLLDNANIKAAANIDGSKLAVGSIPTDRIVGGIPGLTVVQKPATADLTLSTSAQDISGCTYTTTVANSSFLIFGNFNIQAGALDASSDFAVGQLAIGGSVQTNRVTLFTYEDGTGTDHNIRTQCSFLWNTTGVASGTIIKLQASVSGGANGTVYDSGTAMTVIKYA